MKKAKSKAKTYKSAVGSQSFTVVYEEAPEGGYVARVPALQGCHTQGETIEEVKKNIVEAAELYLECLTEEERKERFFKPIEEFVGTISVRQVPI